MYTVILIPWLTDHQATARASSVLSSTSTPLTEVPESYDAMALSMSSGADFRLNENSFAEDTMRITYEDPAEEEERARLLRLFGGESTPQEKTVRGKGKGKGTSRRRVSGF